MYKFYLIFLLSASSFATNTLSLKKQIGKETIDKHLTYFIDSDKEFTIETIKSCEFSAFKDKVFPGLFRKKFWFKLHIDSSGFEAKEYLFRIKAYAFINNLKVYAVTAKKTIKIFEHNEFVDRKIDIPFRNDVTTTYYFETDFYMPAYLNMSIQSEEYYNSIKLKEQIFTGLYYGFCLLILTINFLFYFITKKPFFIFYVLFQLCITASILYLDNYIYDWFGFTFITKAFNVLLNICLSIFGTLFVYAAFNLKKYFPNFKYIFFPIILISIFFYVLYLNTWDYKWSSYGRIGYLSILVLLLLTAIICSFKQVYARFFVLAYSTLLTCHVLYLLPVAFGYKDFGFNEWHYKIGSIIEMLVFMTAIPYRYRVLSTEKTSLEEKISIQEANFKKKIETLKNANISVEEQLIKFKKVYDLKKREVEVLEIMNTGATNKEIADKLFISLDTVKHYCSKLYEKTGAKNRTKLITLFNERDFSETDLK